jgi:hypothetical protein
VLSAISGCVWAGIAWVLLDQPRINVGISGAVLASPLIGIFMGRFSKTFREHSFLVRVTIALLTLYCAAVLFGAAGGFSEFALSFIADASRTPFSVIFQTAWVFVWGLTFLGYFIVLWPLAYLNHSFVACAWAGSDRRERKKAADRQ